MWLFFIPAGKVLYWADKQAVREYFAQKVAVLDSVVHISPVAVLEDDGLTSDFVKDGMQTVHILQKQLSADEAVVVDAKAGHSVHQEVGPLVMVQAQQQLHFGESVASQQSLRT